MINILKLRQLEKDKKQQTPSVEETGVSIPQDTAADKAVAAETENEAQTEINKPQKKSVTGKAKKKKSAEPEKQSVQIETPETDPAELFRQNLIQQILQDETMISREEYLREIGELPAAEDETPAAAAEAEEMPQMPAEAITELPEPVLAEPVPDEAIPAEPAPAEPVAAEPVLSAAPEPVTLPKPEIKREVYSDQLPLDTPKPAGILKTSEYEKNDEQKSKKGKDTIIQMVGFTIGNEYYGVDICKIKEINRMTEITKVPRAPEFIEGVINLRGSVIPVINLRTKVRMPRKEYDKDTRIIIVELSGKTIGFIVDGVREVLRIPDSLLDPPPALAVGKRADYITHVAKLEDDLVILMDPERVLSNDEVTKLK